MYGSNKSRLIVCPYGKRLVVEIISCRRILTWWELLIRMLVIKFDKILKRMNFAVINARKIVFYEIFESCILPAVNVKGTERVLWNDLPKAFQILILPLSVDSFRERSVIGFTTLATD
jgi:hypothetical protein